MKNKQTTTKTLVTQDNEPDNASPVNILNFTYIRRVTSPSMPVSSDLRGKKREVNP